MQEATRKKISDYVLTRNNLKQWSDIHDIHVIDNSTFMSYKDEDHYMMLEIYSFMLDMVNDNGPRMLDDMASLYDRCSDFLYNHPDGIAYIENEKKKTCLYTAKI